MNSNSYDDELNSNEGHEVHLGFSNSAVKVEEEKDSMTGTIPRYNTRASRAAQRGLNKRGNKLLEKNENG